MIKKCLINKKIGAWRKKNTDDSKEESISADPEEEGLIEGLIEDPITEDPKEKNPINQKPKEDPIIVKPKDNPFN